TLNANFTGDMAPPPVAYWFHWVDPSWLIGVLFSLFFVALCSCILKPEFRFGRIVLSLCMLYVLCVQHSQGVVAHGQNSLFWMTFLLIFLPSEKKKRNERIYKMKYITVFWWTLLATLSVYTLSGAWKLGYGLAYQTFVNGQSFLHEKAMAYHLATYALRNGYEPPFADFVIQHSWVGWPLLVGAIYMQFFAFFAAFRPLCHGPWLLMLMSFHALSLPLMNLPFNHQGFMAAIVLGAFPFIKLPRNIREATYTLPLFGVLARFLREGILPWKKTQLIVSSRR
ncbi:MAG: hypothetical protein AAF203_02295, partial [Pseudomonadota bacterium]